ncbi:MULTISPECIES: lysophospholipid acyltransferase family protein [unclassified Sphingomonas]|jgi:1-acyl-sn-glycerol-3-phosphate acyltransferase|uniref:lysophospholipid acyltransferase family protein n=1 Tax=unclassified Sphingomonas TaxID=196159 RepID=UPI0004DF4F07|nr:MULTISPECIES: lysophospholipid acyltransferase family protein [unclassified Sphingomonas]MBD8469711.1 1-acyl-sn-glycerol-3-phosphate acyltransferase [Sphingomonas sp. CFBP 8765]MDY1009074.1 lysophospholipid acyltransferase family protein [Sphingomonas sp. CFBP9019]
MIAWLRTIVFMIVFYSISAPIVLTVPISALFGSRAVIVHSTVWTRFHRWATRWILGIRIRIEGTRPDVAAFYACKHQAMFETLELQALLDGPAIVLKRELADIPAWGWAARRYGAIVVDRDASAKALRNMMREAIAAKATGRSVLIFPEGTRVVPGEHPPLKPGFAGLYRALGMPTVPIACDSGTVWPRKGPKRAGVITFRFGEVVPAGLKREEAEARVHAAMNALDG